MKCFRLGSIHFGKNLPNGYLIAEDVKFTVEDTGEIQKVVMKDEVKPEETPTPETPSTQVTDTPKPEMIHICCFGFCLQ